MNDSVKRFIAGASCPECGEQDSIVSYQQLDDRIRECVECGFKQRLSQYSPQAYDHEKTESKDFTQSIRIKQL